MSAFIDLTRDEEAGEGPAREVIYISDDEQDPQDPLSARTNEDCDPTIKRNGEDPAILVGACTFRNENGELEDTALAYLKNTQHSGVSAFTGEDIVKGDAVLIYGGSLQYIAPCSRANLPPDHCTHVLSLPGRFGIDSKVTEDRGWRYYVEETRNVAGFANASTEPNCHLIIAPRCDKVAKYVLQRRGVEPNQGEIQVIAFFRALMDLPKGTQLLWNYRCDPHRAPEGAEMVLVDPNPPRGRW